MDYDVIVIGSGFGGAITACRLAESGRKVLILERGRRWDKTNYPRQPEDAWVWDPDQPEKKNGWLDLRVFRDMTVAQGAAVGGGSLIYANVSAIPPEHVFDNGWPPEITFTRMQPFYQQVGAFMNVQKVPDNQWTERMRLMRDAANNTGNGSRFQKVELAISFDPAWSYQQVDPHSFAKSKTFTNAQGVQQGTCVHLGNCVVGCDVDAKNTLDRNYIAWAEKHQAEVRPLHLATNIESIAGGYKISYDELRNGQRIPGSATAELVIVAAGSLGSTELLLRCKLQTQTLPNVSDRLGHNWSSNGDFLTPAFHFFRNVNPTRGPTIACIIDFHDRSVNNQSFWIQDGGFPDVLSNLQGGESASALVRFLNTLLRSPLAPIMPWFAQGIDAADGKLKLRNGKLDLDWDIDTSEAVIEAIVEKHEQFASATGGLAVVPPTWRFFKDLITPHPLGGCNMGTSAANGVVDHRGEVFGHPKLYVIDGAIVPEAVGVNPSRTIGALAERAAKMIIDGT